MNNNNHKEATIERDLQTLLRFPFGGETFDNGGNECINDDIGGELASNFDEHGKNCHTYFEFIDLKIRM